MTRGVFVGGRVVDDDHFVAGCEGLPREVLEAFASSAARL